jgi:hypothetical protein
MARALLDMQKKHAKDLDVITRCRDQVMEELDKHCERLVDVEMKSESEWKPVKGLELTEIRLMTELVRKKDPSRKKELDKLLSRYDAFRCYQEAKAQRERKHKQLFQKFREENLNLFELKIEEKCGESAKRIEDSTKLIRDHYEALKKVEEECVREKIQNLLVRDPEEWKTIVTSSRHDAVKESIKFFVCQVAGCSGALCLSCMKPLESEAVPSHLCDFDDLEQLYQQVLEALAKASSRSCPTCGTVGMNDLKCTHILCSSCLTRWCYVCGVAEKNIIGGFSQHNKWTPETPDYMKQCPMYLQLKYGEKTIDNPRLRDPARALQLFHLELKEEAIEAIKRRTDPKLWERLLHEKFPAGIL